MIEIADISCSYTAGPVDSSTADDAILFHGSGSVENKTLFIANLFRRLEFESVTRGNVRIRQLARTVAIASCRTAGGWPDRSRDHHRPAA